MLFFSQLFMTAKYEIKLEILQKRNVVYILLGLYLCGNIFIYKEERNVILWKVYASRNHYNKQNEIDSERQIYFLICVA